MKVYDISAYQGKVDIETLCKDIETYGLIFRTTVKAGNIDTAYKSYISEAIKQRQLGSIKHLAGYKFAYSRTYYDAFLECMQTLQTLHYDGTLSDLDMFYLDLEDWSSRPYTTQEANEVIMGYKDACEEMDVPFGLYFNLNYLRNIIDKRWSYLPLWVARYNKELGNTDPWRPWLWQNTSDATHPAIEKRVDANVVLRTDIV